MTLETVRLLFADDPELAATFRTEVDERLGRLTRGLIELPVHPDPHVLAGRLLREAHTLKGSARVIGLPAVVTLAHELEELLVGLRDGRRAVGPEISDDGLRLVERVRTAAAVDVTTDIRVQRDGAGVPPAVSFLRLAEPLTRLVDDVGLVAGVDARCEIRGEQVLVDRAVAAPLLEVLTHLVINAVDHGCEPVEERLAAGKAAGATVVVAARRSADSLLLEVSDDGRGVDETAVRANAVGRGTPGHHVESLLALLTTPGLSTRRTVTATSGRGMGLEAVRVAMARLGGHFTVRTTPGRGTTFTLRVPTEASTVRCLVLAIGDQQYAVPAHAVSLIVPLRGSAVRRIAGRPALVLDGRVVSLVRPGGGDWEGWRTRARWAIVAAAERPDVAWAVDAILGEREAGPGELLDLAGIGGTVRCPPC